jgi:hypothetical protein
VTEFDKLAQLVESGVEPKVACQKVRLCDSHLEPANQVNENALKQLAVLESKVKALAERTEPCSSSLKDIVSCLFCEYTAELIHQVAQYSKDIVPLLKQGLGLLCSQIQVSEIQKKVIDRCRFTLNIFFSY